MDVAGPPAEGALMPSVVARRSFLGAVVALPFASAAASAQQAASASVRPGPRTPRIKLSCNLYSFNEPLRAKTMTLEGAFDFCAELGFEAVDPTGYYFPGYPEAPADSYIYAIKKHAFQLGLEVSGTGVRNDFTTADRAKRLADVVLVKRWVDVAAKLGAPMVRVFAGPAAAVRSLAETTDAIVEHIRDCVAYGAERGVLIVLQEHDDFLRTAPQTLALRERIGSDWFGLNVDIGSLRTTADPYAEIAQLAPYAYTWQIKEEVYRKGVAEATDVTQVVRILRETAYRGYIQLETLGGGDPRPKLRGFLDRVRQALA
jgi:sugar phosphate isomerase/epimerase